MKIELFQVDAFTSNVFGGNPAAVCILIEWLDEKIMQQIAAENNLAETAFIVPALDRFEIRWFTPTVEVELCGHATLAAAHVLYNHLNYQKEAAHFFSFYSGMLSVKKSGAQLSLDFPTDTIVETTIPTALQQGFNSKIVACYKGKTDYMLVFDTQADIENLEPNMDLIASVDARGVIVTAPGTKSDFVSRFFAPQSGIVEDPVTGSAHTSLIPYWSQRLAKKSMTARQLSPRLGKLLCEDRGDRVSISGNAVTYLAGQIEI
jgi:PhzF family phenazine biosynthesis protein